MSNRGLNDLIDLLGEDGTTAALSTIQHLAANIGPAAEDHAGFLVDVLALMVFEELRTSTLEHRTDFVLTALTYVAGTLPVRSEFVDAVKHRDAQTVVNELKRAYAEAVKLGEEPAHDGVGAIVPARLAEIRDERDLKLSDVAEELERLGHPLSVNTLSKIENGQRRVTVEDLVALAAALNVSPNWLLLPPTADPDTRVAVGDVVWPAAKAWQWALQSKPPGWPADTGGTGGYDFCVIPHGKCGTWPVWVAMYLQGTGCRVFHRRMIQLGERWVEALERAAATSDIILFVAGEGGTPSDPLMMRLAEDALKSGKRVVPVLVSKDTFVPEPLSGRVSLVLTDTPQDEAERRLDHLVGLVQRPRLDPRDKPPYPGAADQRGR